MILFIFSYNSPPHLFFFPIPKVAKFHMKFAIVIFSLSQICLLWAWLAEFQIIFSEVTKQIILNGLIGISNCSPESTHTKEVLSQKRINMYFKMATSNGGEESGILPAVFLVVYSSLTASPLGLLTNYFIILRAWRHPSHIWDPVAGRHTLMHQLCSICLSSMGCLSEVTSMLRHQFEEGQTQASLKVLFHVMAWEKKQDWAHDKKSSLRKCYPHHKGNE